MLLLLSSILGREVLFTDRACRIFLKPGLNTLGMKLMCARQMHTILSFLEVTIANNAHVFLALGFFLFCFVLIDWILLYLLFR